MVAKSTLNLTCISNPIGRFKYLSTFLINFFLKKIQPLFWKINEPQSFLLVSSKHFSTPIIENTLNGLQL